MTVRETVFDREGQECRVCRASLRLPTPFGYGALEWAHLKARGMGGNPDGSRNTTANTICCCGEHHKGSRSLHSGHIKYRFLSDKGADGPMAFEFCERLPKAECGLNE